VPPQQECGELAYSRPAAPAPGVWIYEQLRALTNQALHHGRCVMRPMLRNEGLDDLGRILGRSLAILEPNTEARVMNCKAFGLIELPARLPQRGFRTHLQMVAGASARGSDDARMGEGAKKVRRVCLRSNVRANRHAMASAVRPD
jgi:hypothetical protein